MGVRRTRSRVNLIDPVDFIINFKRGKDAMIIQLKNVRLAFPDIWTPVAFEEGQEKKYGATFLIQKNDAQIKAIQKAINEVAVAQWKEKAKTVLGSLTGNANKICFVDGETKAYDGFSECMALSAKNKRRPLIVDRNKEPLIEDDGKPYSGCYVNASLEIWAQENKWGKGIRATLRGIQFLRDGDQFGGGSVANQDEFEDFSSFAEDDLL